MQKDPISENMSTLSNYSINVTLHEPKVKRNLYGKVTK